MEEMKQSTEHARAVIKWAKTHRRAWRAICTPNDAEMTPELMKKLAKRFHKRSLDELIFVMLTVHRNTPFVSDLLADLTNCMLYQLWNAEREVIVDRIINYL